MAGSEQRQDSLIQQALSALRKPWVNGKFLQIIDGKPTWGDAPTGGGGGGGGGGTYAVQVKRHTGTNLGIPDDTETVIDFTQVYAENNGGVLFPADGGVWPPAPTDSMFTTASNVVLTAPVDGLWGFRAAYRYVSLPIGTWHRTRIDHNNGTVANNFHAREAAGPSGDLSSACEIVGTCRMEAGDYLKVWTRQASGAAAAIYDSITFNDDEPDTGPIFAMWLIAPL